MYSVASRSDIPILKRALALRSVLNGFRAGRHSRIVVSVIESGVLAGMPSRQRSGGGVRRGVTGSASIGAAASARASATVPTASALVFHVSGRSHARAYRRHRQLQSVVPGRARFRVSKRRFTAIVVVVVVVVAAVAVRRSLRSKISVGAVDATRSFDRETEKLARSPLLVCRRWLVSGWFASSPIVDTFARTGTGSIRETQRLPRWISPPVSTIAASPLRIVNVRFLFFLFSRD